MDAGVVVEVKESLEAALPRFVVDAQFVLDGLVERMPAPLVTLLAQHDLAGNPMLVAAIAARFALLRGPGMGTGVDDPLFRAACAWWRGLSRRQRAAQEDFAESLAAGLLADVEQARGAGERLADADLELLALRRDDLASVCGFMLVAGEGAGRDARAVQMSLDSVLDDVYAEHAGATFTSAWLATVAAYRGGWWAVAPGAEPPALAADAYCNVDEDDDGDGDEDGDGDGDGYDEWDDGDEDDEGEGDADWEDEGVEDWDEE